MTRRSVTPICRAAAASYQRCKPKCAKAPASSQKWPTEDGLPGVGWLTYLRDRRAAALRNDVRLKFHGFDTIDGGGTLITFDRQIIDANNPAQVSKARLLRNILIEQQLINV